jgi:hypothetical protein
MLLMAAPLELTQRLKLKLERADRHLFDLKETWDAFVGGDPYPFRSEDDPHTGDRIYKLVSAGLIPSSIPLIAGDAIQNLRSALDHLAYHLVSLGPSEAGHGDKIYFPIGERAKEFDSRLRQLKKHLRPDAIRPLEAVEAHEDGSGEILWHLHCLNIIDKHRLLLTVSSQNVLHSMSPREVSDISRNFLGVFPIPSEIAHTALLQESETPILDPKIGDILARIPRSDVQDKMHFPFEVAFGEPRVVRGKPVTVFLHQVANRIDGIISELDRVGALD